MDEEIDPLNVPDNGESSPNSNRRLYDESLDRFARSIDHSLDSIQQSDDLDKCLPHKPVWLDFIRTSRMTCLLNTPHGDRLIGLILECLQQGACLHQSLVRMNQKGFSGKLGKLLQAVCVDAEERQLPFAFERNSRGFGDLAVSFVRLGSDKVGIISALQHYQELRAQLKPPRRSNMAFRATTRKFALTAAHALEISGDVVESIYVASKEGPWWMRHLSANARDALRIGETLETCLPIRSIGGPGFESEFVKLVGEGLEWSALPAMLRRCAAL